jgi:hypothetical protein
MPERSSLTQVVQWGIETSGAAASGQIRMSAMGFEPSPQTEGGDFRPSGSKFKTLAWVGKSWTEGSISGQATYNELIFPLASVIGIPTTGGASTGWTYSFTPSVTGADSPRTFTVEQGEAGNFNWITNVIFKEMGLSFDRSQIQMSGSAYGRRMITRTTAMSSVTATPTPVMVLPKDVSVYYGTSYAAITASPSGAKLTRVMNTDFSIGNRFNPVWVLDNAQDSYVASVEAEPDLRGSMLLEADAQGQAVMNDLQASTTKYFRIESVSTERVGGTGAFFKLTIDLAVKVADTDGYSDEDGVYAVGYNFIGVSDPQMPGASAINITLTNSLAPSAHPAILTPGI